MVLTAPELTKILVDLHYVTAEAVAETEKLAVDRDVSPIDILIERGSLSSDLLGQAIAEYYQTGYWDLQVHPPSDAVLALLPQDFIVSSHLVPVQVDEAKVVVTTDRPEDTASIDQLAQLLPKQEVFIYFSLPEQVEHVLLRFRQSLAKQLLELKAQKQSATKLLDAIFEEAIARKSSDIHFEPYSDRVRIRLRIDGVLQEAAVVEPGEYRVILNRIKVLAKLRIDEHNATQDGAIRYQDANGSPLDFRVSIVPLVEGEKVVIRVLKAYLRNITLSELGFEDHEREIFTRNSRKPFGMILISGPTGSGKTTTLYALLKQLNSIGINIATIEDPVEYKIPGVNHMQVDPAREITFAKGLRSIVRQDPDVILVGEIRDEETAEIGVNASLTGHLLLTTFHANDAATAIPRLLDMNIQPFLLASTLELVVSQRLLRTVCETCRQSTTVDRKGLIAQYPHLEKHIKSFFKEDKVTMFAGAGCDLCHGSGYRGRVAVAEFIEVTPEIKELILTSPSMQSVREAAAKQGSGTMFENGLRKVQAGATTLEELLRVVPPQA